MTASTGVTLPSLFKLITHKSSEADVEQKLIISLLRILGYSDGDWHTQFFVAKSRVDFLVILQDSAVTCPPYLVIEVKAPSKNVAYSVWQISKYMRKSGAVIGLLTNGYTYRLLYNYKDKIVTIAEYSQITLIQNYALFHRLLCKATCLKVNQALYQSQQGTRLKFLSLTLEAFANKDMLELLKKSLKPPQKRVTSTVDTKLEAKSVILEPKEESKSMIITVFNNKGGVGKTTTTINLAAALNQLGKRVLLIDIDAQANLTTGLGVDPLDDVEMQGKKDISHLLTEPRTTLENTVIRKRWGDIQLDIVPSHIRLSDMEATLIMTPDIDRVLAKKLKKYQEQYDYVFIDPPPSFGKANIIALMAASAVLIPTQLSPYPIRALEYVVNRAIALDKSREDALPILGIAVSMYNRAATKVTQDMAEQIFAILEKNPDSKNVELWPQNTWIPNLGIVSTTPGKGYPLCYAEFDDDLSTRDREAAQDAFSCYTALAKHLISITQVKE